MTIAREVMNMPVHDDRGRLDDWSAARLRSVPLQTRCGLMGGILGDRIAAVAPLAAFRHESE